MSDAAVPPAAAAADTVSVPIASSDAILEDLFTSIKQVAAEEEEEEEEEDTDEETNDEVGDTNSGEEEDRSRSRSKKKKKKEKRRKKKKRKKHRRKLDDDTEEEEEEEKVRIDKVDERRRSRSRSDRRGSSRRHRESPDRHHPSGSGSRDVWLPEEAKRGFRDDIRGEERNKYQGFGSRSRQRSTGRDADDRHFYHRPNADAREEFRRPELRRHSPPPDDYSRGHEHSRGGHRHPADVGGFGRRRDNRPPQRQEARPPIRRDEDTFWDSTWDAMELQKRVDLQERRGKHYLETERRHRRSERTPPLNQSPKRRKRRERSSSSECEELKSLRKLKEIQELVVKDSEKYVAEPLDPKLFQWDNVTKMWRRKKPEEEIKQSKYEEELRQRMEEQFAKQRQENPGAPIEKEEKTPVDEGKDDKCKVFDGQVEEDNQKIDSSQMTLDEIEDIRDKRERNQKRLDEKNQADEQIGESEGDKPSREKEEGEVHSDDDVPQGTSNKQQQQRKRSRSRSREHRRRSRERSHDRHHSRSGSTRRRYSPPPRRFSPQRGRNYRSPEYSRRYRRSRSRDDRFRGSRSAIDKAKLLAIAKKNAVKLLSSDNLMGIDHDRLIAIKSGGQSLSQLTDFCRELAKKGITNEFSDDDDAESEKEYHHPFMVKDRPLPNPMFGSSNAPSGIGLESLTPAMKTAAKTHRMLEFPVSSGNAHRVKEASVEEEEVKQPPAAVVVVEVAKEVETAQPTAAEKLNAQNPLGVLMFGGHVEPSPPQPLLAIEGPSAPPPQQDSSKDKVFADVVEPAQDIGLIVSQRLTAMRKLSNNPHDPEALQQMYEVQKQMSTWAASKNKPGQFTGHTGAKVLSKGELSQGIQAWAKQDQFTEAKKVSGGFGEFLLKKMGWQEGEGLGKDRSGDVDPLTLDIKMDKRGLMAAEENMLKRRRGGSDVLTLTACKDISGKHPVSALMELATKRHWGPPNFTQAFECGPSHKKIYIFKVTVNGVDYQPTIACDNKKKAKADAATKALIELGLLPKDPNNPL